MDPDTSPRLHRRGLIAAGVAGLAAGTVTAPRAAAPRLSPTASTTEGPYYFDARRVRSDITEDLPGVPLELRITVLDLGGQPLAGMRVDVWHCDAQGRYSGYARPGDDRSLSTEGQAFLRGTQPTDALGAAVFRTIYPGWYAGRTAHVHFKLMNGPRAVLTSQCFLPDALSEFLYTRLAPYARGRLRDTLNAGDGIAIEAGGSVLGAVREERDRYVATLTVVVDPEAEAPVDRPPRPGERPPGEAEGVGPDRPAGPTGSGWPAAGRRPAPSGEERTRSLVPGG